MISLAQRKFRILGGRTGLAARGFERPLVGTLRMAPIRHQTLPLARTWF